MIRYLSIVLALTICLTASISGALDASVPFVEDFEDGLSGVWTVADTSGTAIVQSTNVLAGEDINNDGAEGTESLTANLADLTLSIDAGENATNVWFLFYSMPTPYNDTIPPAVPTTDAAAFYLNATGAVRAMDSGAWVTVETGVPTDEWLAFAVQLDYDADQWNLFLSQDNTYGTVLTKLNNTPLAFGADSSGLPHLTNFTLKGVAALDAVAVQEDTKFQSKTNLVVKMLELTPGEQTRVGFYAHDYSSLQDTIATNLGVDLYGWLEDGDIVTMFDTNSQSFRRDSSEFDLWLKLSSLDETDAHIPPGTGLWVTKGLANSEPYLAFMDYSSLTTDTKPVLGYNSGGYGLNLLSWDKPGVSLQLGDGLGAAGFADIGEPNDRLYLKVSNGKGATRTKRLWWDEGNGIWMDGANPASDTLAPGQVFWYYRGGSPGDDQWDIENAK